MSPSALIAGNMGVLGNNVISGMRQARGDLVKRVMLDPDWARQLPAKAPAKPGTGSSLSIAAQLRRLSAFFPLVASQPAPTKH